jgi:MFS family permease
VLAYTFSYIDRTIITLMVAPIRASLHISDTELSLLHGLAFAIFYTVLGIPLGRWADRHHRVRLAMAGVFFWSLMTALCGLARNFLQIFLARVGVGVGEAALSPSVYSILTDYFPPRKLSQAMSVYTAAIYIGAGIALIAGGALIAMVPAMDLPIVGHMEPWQVVFLWVGLPGFLIVFLMGTVREPVRRGLLKTDGAATVMSFGTVVRYLVDRRGAYFLMMIGYGCLSLAFNGVGAWIPTYFMRVHHWTVQTTGLNYGLVQAVCGSAGIVCGGTVASLMKARGYHSANVLAGVISGFIMLPSGIIAPLLSDAYLSLAIYAVFVFGAAWPFGAAAAAFQELTPNQMRGQVTAIYFFFLNLAGIGTGPTVVATITDRVFHDDTAVYLSNAIVAGIMAPIGIFLLWRALKPYESHLLASKFTT